MDARWYYLLKLVIVVLDYGVRFMKDKVKISLDSLTWSWVCGCGGQGGGSSCGGILHISVGLLIGIVLEMSLDSRRRSRSRSRSPMDRKMRTQRYSYRDAPYSRDSRRGFRLYGLHSFICLVFCCKLFGLERRQRLMYGINVKWKTDLILFFILVHACSILIGPFGSLFEIIKCWLPVVSFSLQCQSFIGEKGAEM